MKEAKKACCTARSCPCYPDCDQMMEENWTTQHTKSLALDRLDQDQTELMRLAKQDEEDLEKLKELYPVRIRQILAEVEKVCDSMEYEGSIMFDELPEKHRILELREGIREKMEPQMENWEQEALDQQEEDIYVMNHRGSAGNRRPPQPPGPPYPPRRPGKMDWFGDLIQVLLQDEMYHRRCRHRNCRRW